MQGAGDTVFASITGAVHAAPPKGVIAFPGSGITDNLVDKAIKLGIPVRRVTA